MAHQLITYSSNKTILLINSKKNSIFLTTHSIKISLFEILLSKKKGLKQGFSTEQY